MTPPRTRHDQPGPVPAVTRAAGVAVEVTGLDVPVEELTDDTLRARLGEAVDAERRLSAWRCKAIAELSGRSRAQAEAAAPDDGRAGLHAQRELERELRDELKLTPSQVKTAGRIGRRLSDIPGLEDAMTAGHVSLTQARVLDKTMAGLDLTDREALAAELVPLAEKLDDTAFGRECRRRLATLDLTAAEAAEDRRHARRRGAVTQTPDGMTAVSAEFAGLDAEIAHTAIHAFRRPDAPGEHRTTEQRTADAIIAAFRAALDGGSAPADHTIAPHVLVTVDADTLLGDGLTSADQSTNVAEAEWTGPLVWTRVRHLLAQAGMHWLTVGRNLDTFVTSETRNVPVGLFKALQHRDAGCIHHTCDMPAPWTQVMHLNTPYAEGGKLTLNTAALGCTFHHRLYDQGQLTLTWHKDKPVLKPPGADPPT